MPVAAAWSRASASGCIVILLLALPVMHALASAIAKLPHATGFTCYFCYVAEVCPSRAASRLYMCCASLCIQLLAISGADNAGIGTVLLTNCETV
jgi:hypothetical protein